MGKDLRTNFNVTARPGMVTRACKLSPELDYKFKTSLSYTGIYFFILFKVMANLGAVVTEPPCGYSSPLPSRGQ